MSIDYGEKEREFLDSLGADTGRDLAAWMSAIAAANLSERNEIIDWLRHQGFMFSKASWLERIFNNGGKPIYGERGRDKPKPRSSTPLKQRSADSPPAGQAAATPAATAIPISMIPVEPAPTPAPPMVPATVPASPPLREPSPTHAATPSPSHPAPPRLAAAPAPQADLEATLAKAKAFRPLALYVLGEIRKALPGAIVEPYTNHVAILLEDVETAVLAISAKDIRLYIAALGMPFDGGFSPAKSPQGLIGVRLSPTHMVTLTDARAVTPELIERVRAASLGAAGKS